MVMSSSLAGPLVRAISRSLVCAHGSRIGGAGTASSLSLARGLLLSPSRDYKGLHSSVPAAAPALLAASKPCCSVGPARSAHGPSSPRSRRGPSLLILRRAGTADPASTFPASAAASAAGPSLARAALAAQLSSTIGALGVTSPPSFPPTLSPIGVWKIPPAFGEGRHRPRGHRGHGRLKRLRRGGGEQHPGGGPGRTRLLADGGKPSVAALPCPGAFSEGVLPPSLPPCLPAQARGLRHLEALLSQQNRMARAAVSEAAEERPALEWQQHPHPCALQVKKIVRCIHGNMERICTASAQKSLAPLLLLMTDRWPRKVVTSLLELSPSCDRYCPQEPPWACSAWGEGPGDFVAASPTENGRTAPRNRALHPPRFPALLDGPGPQ